MEFARHHVEASGSHTLRDFFNSSNVDFDPPSLSLRENIKKAKSKYIYDLADGATGDDEENSIRDAMANSENSYELIRLFGVMEGWSELDNELPEEHLDPIAARLAQVLDQRDYPVYKLIRRHLVLLDYGASPELGDCILKILQWPSEFQPAEIDAILLSKGELFKRVASATLRDRTNMIKAARVHPIAVIQRCIVQSPHRATELVSMLQEVNYTTRICAALVTLTYQALYAVLSEMYDPAFTPSERTACCDTCKRLELKFSAAAKAVAIAGDNQAKSTVDRFTLALKAAIDNFTTTLPAPTALTAIIAALGAIGDDLADLQTAITNLPDVLDGITLADFLGTGDDDKARQLISDLHSQGLLEHASFNVKLLCINALLGGSTDDDDEIAINKALKTSKNFDQAELYQLASAATWESLYTSVNGDEYDELEAILQMPS